MSWLRFCNFVTKSFKGSNPLKTKENAKISSNDFVAANNPWAFILVSASQASSRYTFPLNVSVFD